MRLRPKAAATCAAALLAAIAASEARAQAAAGTYNPSRVTPLSGSITSASVSQSFPPQSHRGFHVQLSGTAVVSCPLERSFDAGATWGLLGINVGGALVVLYDGTFPSGSQVTLDVADDQTGVLYRLDCGGGSNGSYTSGTLNYVFYQ